MVSYYATYFDQDENNVINEEIEVEVPRICMHCRNTGSQVNVSSVLTYADNDKYDGLIITACSYCGCTSIHGLKLNMSNSYRFFSVQESFPKAMINIQFSEHINTAYPEFIKIYNQSEEAEKADLNHLAGMGYRKSLEYLVTDFLKAYPVEDVELSWLEDPKTSLKNKIDKIQNARIKKLATAITYLGNDQTHYTQRHPEYGIEQIKTFIRALVSNIEQEIALNEAEEFLNKS